MEDQKSPSFLPASKVKGLRFGGQLLIKNFTIRRASPPQLFRLLPSAAAAAALSTTASASTSPFSSTAAYLPTNFTILAHHALHTLTLGLGTKKSKVVIFVFESGALRAGVERSWPSEIALGEVNRRLIRGLAGLEMARFKFRKGCITFYVYAVRREGSAGFSSGEELRRIVQAVASLNDFLDHTAMLAMPHQKSISHIPSVRLATMAH
ncbi:unnamed protein product [Victoria cruziana]